MKKTGYRYSCFDSWLLFKLTGEHVTDVTNASRTLLMDLETLKWMKDILVTLDIPQSSMPEIKPSLYNFGTNSDLLKNVVAGILISFGSRFLFNSSNDHFPPVGFSFSSIRRFSFFLII